MARRNPGQTWARKQVATHARTPCRDHRSQHDEPACVRSPEFPSFQSHPQEPEQEEVHIRRLQHFQQGRLRGREHPGLSS